MSYLIPEDAIEDALTHLSGALHDISIRLSFVEQAAGFEGGASGTQKILTQADHAIMAIQGLCKSRVEAAMDEAVGAKETA